MAEKKKYTANGEHAFVRIERDLKNDRIPGVVLLCGREDYLTHHYSHAILDRYLNPASRQLDLSVLEGKNVSMDQIESAALVLPLLSQRRVIFLPGFVDSRGKLPELFQNSEKMQDSLAEYMKTLPEGVLLLITAEKPVTTGDYKKQSDGRKLRALQAAVKKAGGAEYDFGPLTDAQLKGFIAKRLKASGKGCEPGVIRRIIRDSGYGGRYTEYDLYTLENDLKKLAACSTESIITERDAAMVLTDSPEVNVFRMLDAVGRNRKDQALISLNTLYESGESDQGILSNLTGQLELMLIAGELREEGFRIRDAAAYLQKEEKIGEYRAKIVSESASRFTVPQLRFMFSSACDIEKNIKSGLMESRLAFEYFIGIL